MRTNDMKSGANRTKMRTFIVHALSFSAVAALTLNPALAPVSASDYRVAAPLVADGQMNARPLSLGIGKSIVIDLPRDIKDVLVADPKIANAVVRSSQRAYIIGAAVGQTNIVFFDSAGQQIAAYDIAVTRDLKIDPQKVNVNGGSVAYGHPIGASGARVLVTLLHEMSKRDAKKGLATLCIGGGMGVAMCVER